MAAAAGILLFSAGVVSAQAPIELRYLCYGDGDECEVSQELLDRFHRGEPTIRVTVDKVSFNVVREQLETRLSAGHGPDMARITNLGGLNRFYLDLRPYIDATAWEAAFGPTLQWMRAGPNDRGIYGFLTQLTVGGPFVNRTLFRNAGVPLPGANATWDDWAIAVTEVRRRTGVFAGIALDRSGHRFAGPAISYGAVYVGSDGVLQASERGTRDFTERMVRWHRDEVMPRDIWPAATGARLRSGADMFVNGDAVMHVSGSWQIGRFADDIGDRFDWIAVPNPCGTVGCSGMPGGAAMVAFRRTRHPEAVARVMAYMASEPVLREFYERTLQIPAHRGLAKGGLAYPADTPRAAVEALNVFGTEFERLMPQAHLLQAHPRNHVLFNAMAEHVTTAITGLTSIDQTLALIARDVERGGAQR